MESQMRKLSLENSTLQMENKLLKDKHSRAVGEALYKHTTQQFLLSLNSTHAILRIKLIDWNKML